MRDPNYKLRGWMGANRVSGNAMAERINMSRETFKNKINGKTEWKLSEILMILKVTGCKFDEIF